MSNPPFSPIILTTPIIWDSRVFRIQLKLLSLNKNDPTYEVRKEYLKNKMEEDIDAVNSFEQKLKKGKGKRNSKIDSKIADAVDS